MASKLEDKYRAELEAMGVWQPAFAPAVHELCMLEREERAARKAWRATEPDPKRKPSFLDPHYALICKLRQEILQHRDALGLTPKGLRRLRPPTADETSAGLGIQEPSPALSAILDGIRAGVSTDG